MSAAVDVFSPIATLVLVLVTVFGALPMYNRVAEMSPYGRIRNTKKLLATAAIVMSVLLLSSSFVTALLIRAEAFEPGGPAAGRALAYLAHGRFGPVFGTAYDVSTVAILWFAGASALAGLLNFVPRYLPQYGMAPEWTRANRPLVLIITGINIIVTLVLRADVEAQVARTRQASSC